MTAVLTPGRTSTSVPAVATSDLPPGTSPRLHDLARWVSAGNPFTAVGFAVWDAQAGVDGFETLFARAVQRFAAVHVGLRRSDFFCRHPCIVWATAAIYNIYQPP